MRAMHLIKSGSGMAVKSACGRNVLRLPMAVNWDGFKATAKAERCEKCDTSKQAALNLRNDMKNFEVQMSSGWEPVEYNHADDVAKYPKLATKESGKLLGQ